jgi:hypothetical protein
MEQALVDERSDAVEDVEALVLGGARGGFQVETADEDGEPPEEPPLVGGQDVVAPGDHVAHRALSGREVSAAAREQRQPPLQAGEQGGWW